MKINTGLRRRRRKALTVLAVLAAATVAPTAHSALMSSGLGDPMSDVGAVVCVVVGGGLVAAGAVVFVLRGPGLRPTSPLVRLSAPSRDGIRRAPASRARAAPPPLLQVFRL